jgi:hypothetical protein
VSDAKCRCGYDGNGDHPCHGGNYLCKRPATQRFYDCKFVSLAGMQMKVQTSDTWACDECWDIFTRMF